MRLIDAGVVGAVVSRMIDCGVSDHGVPASPTRARPLIVFVPCPLVSVQPSVVVGLE